MHFELTEEQRAIQEMARGFARKEILPQAAHYDHTAEFPHAIVDKARTLGLVGSNVPAEYGGAGVGALEVALIAEELSYACAGIAVAVCLNNLPADALLVAGTEEQKRRFLPRLIEGFGAYALTEPEAGSDAANLRTRAEKRDGKWVLNGRKTWISHAPQAHFMIVFARTDPAGGHRGNSAFLVETDRPGVDTSKNIPKMGQKASHTAEVAFDNVEIPAENLLGKEGDGFQIAMKVFDRSRPMVAAFGVGVTQRALDEAVRYATQRRAFGKTIAEFQGVGFKLAEMAMRLQAARLLTYQACWKIDRGQRNTIEASFAKAFAADTAMWATTEAVQIFGGYGYSQEYPVEKLMRDAKVLQIYEGTSEIQRAIIVRELTRS
jgi:acyl-CoA dehydrogenase